MYWLRFGYFMGGDSASGAYHHHHVAKPGARHQRPAGPSTSATQPGLIGFQLWQKPGYDFGVYSSNVGGLVRVR